MRYLFLILFFLLPGGAFAQSLPSASDDGKPGITVTPTPAPQPVAPTAPPNALETLSQSNHDLLELLKKQQSVLEDIQYDRRLQNRQIQLLEVRLTESIAQNATLQAKIAKLEAQAAAPQPAAVQPGTPNAPVNATATTVPPPPSTYLPPPESEGAPGTKSWHRLFVLSGDDTKTTDVFHVQGPQWRVLWHNLDKPGDAYKNTSALFVNAYPKDDTIPQKVCAKLGSGGDSTELIGPGNYYLKIEASGGSWELAVEDFR